MLCMHTYTAPALYTRSSIHIHETSTPCTTLHLFPAGRTPTPALQQQAKQLRCPPSAVWTRPTPDKDEDFTRPSYVPTPGGSPVIQPYRRDDQPLYTPSTPEFKPAELPEQQKEMPKGPTMPGAVARSCAACSSWEDAGAIMNVVVRLMKQQRVTDRAHGSATAYTASWLRFQADAVLCALNYGA
jgi:hypothetical protein